MAAAKQKDLFNLGYLDKQTGQWTRVPYEYMMQVHLLLFHTFCECVINGFILFYSLFSYFS